MDLSATFGLSEYNAKETTHITFSLASLDVLSDFLETRRCVLVSRMPLLRTGSRIESKLAMFFHLSRAELIIAVADSIILLFSALEVTAKTENI
jgi:hypothetical protein